MNSTEFTPLHTSTPTTVRAKVSRVQCPGKRRNLSKSAVRALDVLEYFAAVGRPLRAIDIAQAFGFHPSSTDQLLKSMVDSAYLVIEPQGKLYYPSPRLVKFGCWLASNYFGEDRIGHLLRAVYYASGELVTLAVRQGAAMQIVDVLEPPRIAGTVLKGSRVPIVGSAIGGAFLSIHGDNDVRRIIQQVCSRAERTADRMVNVLNEVRAIRSAGYASGGINNDGEPWSIAIALPKPSAGAAMVLGLAGPRTHIQEREAQLVALILREVATWLR